MDLQTILPYSWVALVVPFWQQAKAVVSRLRATVVVSTAIQQPADREVYAYLRANYKYIKGGDTRYLSDEIFVRPLDSRSTVIFESVSSELQVFIKNKTVLLVKMHYSKEENTQKMVLTYLRGTVDIEDLFIKAMQRARALKHGNNTERNSRFYIQRLTGRFRNDKNGNDVTERPISSSHISGTSAGDVITLGSGRFLEWQTSELGDPLPADPLEAIAVMPDVRELIAEFDMWLSSEKWFKERLIPWRRGWLIYGEPGTGKSLLTRMLAQRGNIPLFQLDLSTMNNNDLVEAWDNCRSNIPCIASVEDLDSVFEGRKNISEGSNSMGKLSFDCFLNVISGVKDADGIFFIVSTNKVESIDEALGRPTSTGVSTRPGRLDRTLQLPKLDDVRRKEICVRILRDWPEKVHSAVEHTAGMTAAQVCDYCSQIAIKEFWLAKAGTNVEPIQKARAANG